MPNSKIPIQINGDHITTTDSFKFLRTYIMAESRLRQKALVGSVATGRAGIGYFPVTRVDNVQGKKRQHLVQEEVRAGVEEVRASRMVGMGQQGAWSRWESVLQ